MSKDLDKILNIFLEYYTQVNLRELVAKTMYMPPMRLSKLKEYLKINNDEEFVKELTRLCEEGLLRIVDIWVYPGHILYQEMKKILLKEKYYYEIVNTK